MRRLWGRLGAAGATAAALASPLRLFSSTSPTRHASVPEDADEESTHSIIVGNQKLGVYDSSDYVCEQAEFVGALDPSRKRRANAGEVLALVDLVSGRCGSRFLHNIKDYGPSFLPIEHRTDDYVSIVTVAFNSFIFSQTIFEGDLIKVDSRVVSTGKSSIGIHVRVQRQAFDSPEFSAVGESYVTFVTIQGKELTTKAMNKIAAVRLTTDMDKRRYKHYLDIRRQARAMEMKGADAHLRAPSSWTAEAVEMEENKTKPVHVPMASTTTVANRTFWLDDLNTNNVIFGGALLSFMEKAALHCGRVFAQTSHVYTLGMLSMTFDEPVQLTDLPRCTCQVVCVRRSTMLVNVQVVSGRGKALRGTNKASFILVHTGEDHLSAPIEKGIDLSRATEEELHLYWRGRRQLEDSLENRRFYRNNVML